MPAADARRQPPCNRDGSAGPAHRSSRLPLKDNRSVCTSGRASGPTSPLRQYPLAHAAWNPDLEGYNAYFQKGKYLHARRGRSRGWSCPTTGSEARRAMRVALYQPDIPQNAGAIARLVACLGVPLDVVEPCGFLFGDRQLRRAGLDYLEAASICRHASWEAFRATVTPPSRLLLLTTRAGVSYTHFTYAADDVLLFGRIGGRARGGARGGGRKAPRADACRLAFAQRRVSRGDGPRRSIAANWRLTRNWMIAAKPAHGEKTGRPCIDTAAATDKVSHLRRRGSSPLRAWWNW